MATDNEKNYAIIIDAIKKHGTPSSKYQGDIDITYEKLSEVVGNSIGGVMALLRSMKRSQVVDYIDQGMLKASSVVTLLGGNTVATGSDQVPYDKIKDLISDSDKTSHNKIGASATD